MDLTVFDTHLNGSYLITFNGTSIINNIFYTNVDNTILENERRDLSIRVGGTPAAFNLVNIMNESEVTLVLKKLRIAERLRI